MPRDTQQRRAGATPAASEPVPQWQQRSPVDPVEYQKWLDRQHASGSPYAGVAAEMSMLSPELVALKDARDVLLREASIAGRLPDRARAGEIDLSTASVQLAVHLSIMLGPLDAIAKAKHAGGASAAAVDLWLPRVTGALDTVDRARLALVTQQSAADTLGNLTHTSTDGDGARASSALAGTASAFANVAMQIGWQPAANRAQADERRFAVQACPGDAREERPDVCDMSEGDRAALRERIRWMLLDIVDDFKDACEPFKARLESIIARHAATDQLVLGILKSGISMALGPLVDGVVTASLSRAPSMVWTPRAPTTDLKPPKPVYSAAHFAADLAQDRMWSAARASRGPREQKTIGMLDQLIIEVKAGARETRRLIDRLDDSGLRSVEGSLALLDTAFFAAKLGPFVEAYREQIEPLGEPTMPNRDGIPSGQGWRYESVWITIGDRRRLAMVSGWASIGSRHVERRAFVRWIDPQFEALVGMQTLVGGQSPEVPATEIDDMPIGEISTWMLGGAR